MKIISKIRTKVVELKYYLTTLNNKIRSYPKYVRLIYALWLFVASILSIPIVIIPIGLFLFLLSMKIGWDLYKDWKKDRKDRKIYKDVKRHKTMKIKGGVKNEITKKSMENKKRRFMCYL